MNFFDNIPNFNPPIQPMHNPMLNNNLEYKIHEIEQRLKKLEFRITQLENEKNNPNYIEPDSSLYMI